MAVAKRQRKEKSRQKWNKRKPVDLLRSSGLGQFAKARSARRRQMNKRRRPRWIVAFPVGSAHPHASRVCYPLLAE